MIKENTPAPDFSLPDQHGNTHSLSEARGSWVLLYFYPKDDTPGCTMEAEMLRDAYEDFSKHGVVVYGVSADSVESHKKFAEKLNLPFPLLADPEKTTIEAYGVWGTKKTFGREDEGVMRTSFLINPQGEVVRVYEDVNPEDHADEVLADIEDLA